MQRLDRSFFAGDMRHLPATDDSLSSRAGAFSSRRLRLVLVPIADEVSLLLVGAFDVARSSSFFSNYRQTVISVWERSGFPVKTHCIAV